MNSGTGTGGFVSGTDAMFVGLVIAAIVVGLLLFVGWALLRLAARDEYFGPPVN